MTQEQQDAELITALREALDYLENNPNLLFRQAINHVRPSWPQPPLIRYTRAALRTVDRLTAGNKETTMNDQNTPHIPTPAELSYLRDFAKTANGYVKRFVRVITERPELETFSFNVGPLDVAEEVVSQFRAAGWRARFVSKNDEGESKIEIYWPED